jgi:hypothetical protein
MIAIFISFFLYGEISVETHIRASECESGTGILLGVDRDTHFIAPSN